MEIGGGEISLIGLLQAIDYTQYDVDLFVYSHQGELMQFIPQEVNLLPEIAEYAQIESSIKENIIHGFWKIAIGKLVAKLKHGLYRIQKSSDKEDYSYQQYMAKELIGYLPSLCGYGEYDLAISFMHPHNYVLEKVKAKKKICWIHTDYSVVDVNVRMELPVWSGYNHIISISPAVTKAFLKTFPSLKDKIIEVENILSMEFVGKRAELVSQEEVLKEMPKEEGVINLLSIGRFCEAKNYDNVPDICKRINSKLSARWYIIGYGPDEQVIRKRIAEARMEDHVIILGMRTNPYPYIKVCDIYIQPSRYEGKSVTVREAQMLYKPVVVTNYPTASSQIKDGIDGVIVPMDNQGCAEGIVSLIYDKTKQDDIVNYLKTHDYGNEKEVNKLYQLISWLE